MYYLAPLEKFEFRNNDKVRSTIGGILVTHSGVNGFISHPWYICERGDEFEWQAWSQGQRIGYVKLGMFSLGFRPFVEVDLVIPLGAY